LVHRVVEDTCIGAVPVDIVDINLLPLIVELFVKAPVIVSPAFFTYSVVGSTPNALVTLALVILIVPPFANVILLPILTPPNALAVAAGNTYLLASASIAANLFFSGVV